ncbi:TPA: AsmA family protein [Vibrio vulnificus]|uniref:AsmA family protein n=1 Tax=Vibrio vulnificus TaxID=672 RepID=UPI0005427BB0|nr:AsmA family protein [Vibrio vulnificus]EID4339901.1 AsmA family protein [Vibrio vulnificus]EID4375006.1 AsmA family protein [Vibrio vulnificus]KHF89548.1 cell envelope biogenesis protein AsmA [Vibrio vulnificus]KHF93207.1 cell envelope biogenesis protein AsmA [Vibrio vulnificus]RZR30724.1 AsmA family protein [Vibrio vulnificus]
MKKLFLILAAPITVVVMAAIALVTLVNPNQFKPLITEQVAKQTGLELVIEGDIEWQFFPSIGFSLGKTELKNPQGFSQENLFKVESVGIDISVMPLLDKVLQIGDVRLDGAEFHLETRKDGQKNIDTLTQQQKAQQETVQQEVSSEPTTDASQQPGAAADWRMELAGITVSNAKLVNQDRQAGTSLELYDVNFSLSEFAFDQWTKAEFSAKGKNNQQQFSANGKLEFQLAQDFSSYALRNIELNSQFSDPATKMDTIKLVLDTFEFDKDNALTFEIKGQVSGMELSANGSAQLHVDAAISTVMVKAFQLESQLTGKSLPQSPMKVAMSSEVTFDVPSSHLSLVLNKLTANAIALDGKADVALAEIPKVRFSLHSPEIDLDEFLGLTQPSQETASTNSSNDKNAHPEANNEVEPDLSALKTLDVIGQVSIDKFKANNAKLQNVITKFTVNRGIATLDRFDANLYQGSINASAKLDARRSPATYSVKKRIKGVQVQPLLVDVAQNDKLEGTGNIDVDVKGSSLTPSGIQKNLVGTVEINFADGAVNGINVAQMIRENYAKIKGKKLDATDGVQKTDFSSMTATLTLNKGKVTTNNMHMQSPLLRIRGKGEANYINQTVDFTVSTSIVGSLEGQGGKDIDELRDVTIPINISGSWADPKFKLVFDDVLKQKAQKEIDRGVEKLTDKIKDEKTKEAVDGLLKGLFN